MPLTIAIALTTLTSSGIAQMRAPSAPGGTSSSSPGVQDQGASTAKDFDGYTVKVVRMVRDPTTEQGFRLILSVTDTGDVQRSVGLITPIAVLIDEMGNVYSAVGSSGIAICNYREVWDSNLDYCYRHGSTSMTKTTPNLPTTLVLYFVPAESNFSKELAEIATMASLQSRFAYQIVESNEWYQADVVINGIQLPK